jgi:hypothetical protein
VSLKNSNKLLEKLATQNSPNLVEK